MIQMNWSVACGVVMAVGLSASVMADQDCDEPYELIQGLDVDGLGAILLYEAVFGDDWPVSLTARGTAADPVFDVVLGCDGGVPWVACSNEDAAGYQSFFEDSAADGYRPMLVEVYGTYPNERYAAVMVNDGQAARGRHRVALSDLDDTLLELEQQNYEPSWVSVCQGASQFAEPRFALVFEAEGANWSTDRYRLSATIPAADFEATQRDSFQRAGDRLRSMATWTYIGVPFVAATWVREIQPEWQVLHGQSAAAFSNTVDELESAGFEPTFVRRVDGDSGLRVTSGWQFDPPRTWITTGDEVPGLSAFDDGMKAYMQARDATQGALAVSKDGRLVMARGYTWTGDPVMQSIPTEPTAKFRFGSVSKPITA
ncbi:MAG: serine hydrolase, partial [Phycisphaerales bacterium]|nr:serine hydrolase [Phycisphaerales bacterium]